MHNRKKFFTRLKTGALSMTLAFAMTVPTVLAFSTANVNAADGSIPAGATAGATVGNSDGGVWAESYTISVPDGSHEETYTIDGKEYTRTVTDYKDETHWIIHYPVYEYPYFNEWQSAEQEYQDAEASVSALNMILTQKQTILAEWIQKYQMLNEQYATLKEHKAELDADLLDVTNDRNDALSELQESKEELASVQQELESVESINNSNLNSLKAKYQELLDKVNSLEDKIKEYDEQIASLKKQIAEYDAGGKYAQELDKLAKELETAKTNYNAAKAKYDELKAQYDKAQLENESLKRKLSALNTQLQNYVDEKTRKVPDPDNWDETITTDDLQTQLNQYEQILDTLNKALANMQALKKAYQEGNPNGDTSDYDNLINEYKKQIEDLQKQIDWLTAYINGLTPIEKDQEALKNAAEGSLEQQYLKDKIRIEMKQLQNTLYGTKYNAQLTEWQNENSQINTNIAEVDRKIKTAGTGADTTQLEAQKKALETQQSNYKTKIEKLEQLTNKIKKIGTDTTQILSEIESAYKGAARLKDSTDKSKEASNADKIAEYNKELGADADNKIKDEKTLNNDITERNELIRLIVAYLAQDSVNDRITTLQDVIRGIGIEIANSDGTDTSSLTARRDTFNKLVRNLQSQSTDINQMIADANAVLENHNGKYGTEDDELKSSLDSLNADYDKLYKSVKQAAQESDIAYYKDLVDETERLADKYNDTVIGLNNKIEELNRIFKELGDILGTSSDTGEIKTKITDLQGTLADLEKKLSDDKLQMEKNEAAITDLERQLGIASDASKSLEDRIKAADDTIKSLTKNGTSLEAYLKKLADDNASLQGQYDALYKTLQDAKSKAQELGETDTSDWSKVIADLQAKEKSLQEKLNLLNSNMSDQEIAARISKYKETMTAIATLAGIQNAANASNEDIINAVKVLAENYAKALSDRGLKSIKDIVYKTVDDDSLNATNKQLKADEEKLKADIEEITKATANGTEENNKLRASNNDLAAKNQSTAEENRKLLEQISSYNKNNKTLAASVKTLQKKKVPTKVKTVTKYRTKTRTKWNTQYVYDNNGNSGTSSYTPSYDLTGGTTSHHDISSSTTDDTSKNISMSDIGGVNGSSDNKDSSTDNNNASGNTDGNIDQNNSNGNSELNVPENTDPNNGEDDQDIKGDQLKQEKPTDETKKSPMGFILILVVLAAAAGGLLYFAYQKGYIGNKPAYAGADDDFDDDDWNDDDTEVTEYDSSEGGDDSGNDDSDVM